MSEPITKEARDQLRARTEAALQRFKLPWYCYDDDEFPEASIREEEADGPRKTSSYVEIASTSQLGDDDYDLTLPEYLAAVSPVVVLALLDALDQKEGAFERASKMVASRKQGFLDSWGSVEMTIASDHPFAVAGITEIHGVRINVANDVTFIDPTGKDPDIKLAGSKMHFHPDNEPGFGSKATGDFDDDDDGFWGDGDG